MWFLIWACNFAVTFFSEIVLKTENWECMFLSDIPSLNKHFLFSVQVIIEIEDETFCLR